MKSVTGGVMAKQKKDNHNSIHPAPEDSKKRGFSFGIIAIAYIAGLLSGVLLTIYKTEEAPPADPHQHVAQKSSPVLSDRIAELELNASQNPADAGAWIQLGNVCFDADLPDKSIAAYDKALALNPTNADVWTDQGVMYRKIGKFDKAIACFDRAVSVDPKHEIARFNKGIVLMHELDDIQGAMQAWEELLAVNPLAMAPNGQSIDEMMRKMKQRTP
jgi:cytochrome c-type biogenesis protein CcmH/NrfG